MVSITDSFRKNSSRTQKPRKQMKTIPPGNALMSQFDQKNTCCKNAINSKIESAIKNNSFLTLAACKQESILFKNRTLILF